jgi:uncharacterized protein YndB with AHSA1/START domain
MAIATAPQTTSLQVRRTFAASREKVYQAWTDPKALKEWFGPPGFKTTIAEVDLRVGGNFRLTLQKPTGDVVSAFGTFREIRPSERLVCSWNWDYNDIGDSILTLEFHDAGGETELVLTHERFPTVEQRDRHNTGWTGCFDQLEKFLHSQKGVQ